MRSFVILLTLISGLSCAAPRQAAAAAYTFDAKAGDRTVDVLIDMHGGKKKLTGRDISSLFTMTIIDDGMRYTLGGPSGGAAFLGWREEKLIFVTTDALRRAGFAKTVTMSFALRGRGPMKNAAAFFRRLSRAEAEFQGLLPEETVPVPLPGALPLFLGGAAVGGIALRRRKSA